MRIFLRYGITFSLLVLSIRGWTQSIRERAIEKDHLIEVSVWKQQDGLSSWLITDMVKDHTGTLWISTAKGVFRFDGQVFEHYPYPASRGFEHSFAYLAEDPKGNIWVYRKREEQTTSFILAPSEQKTIPFETYTGYSPPYIRGFQDYFRTKDGIYFFSSQGVWRYRDKLEKVATYAPEQDERFFPGPDGRFWKAKAKKGIQLLDSEGNEQAYFPLPHEFNPNSLWLDDAFQLWFANTAKDTFPYPVVRVSQQGLQEFSAEQLNVTNWGNQQKTFEPNVVLPGNGYAILPLKNKQYKVLHNGKVLIPNLDKWLSDRYQINLNLNQLYTLGPSGVVWLSGVGGLIRLKFSPALFKQLLYKPGEIVSARQIANIAPDQLAVCTYKGLFLFNRDNSPTLASIPTLPELKAVFSTGESLWVGTTGNKVYQYFPKQDTYRLLKNQCTVPTKEANTFFRLPSKDLALGSDKGLWLIDSLGGTLSRVALADTAIYFSHHSKNQLWLGTQYGLYHWNTRKLFPFTDSRTQPGFSFEIFHLTEDTEGTFWMATDQGLLKWAPFSEQYQLFGQQDGLPDGRLHAVYQDRKGSLWISSNDGLARFDPKSNRALPLNIPEITLNKELNFLSHHQDASGRLYFGGVNGLVSFQPDSLASPEQSVSYAIQLKKVSFERLLAPDSPLEVAYQESPQDIRIPAHTWRTNLSFSFPYYDQAPAVFQWRIPGYADEWQTSSKQAITLKRLPYGRQALEVRLYIEGLPEHLLTSTQISLQVACPIYLRWWFLLWGGLFLAGMARLFLFWREKQLKAQNRQLQQSIDEKTQKIQRQAQKLEAILKVKNQLFTDISHELRTPLSLIIGHAEILAKELQPTGSHVKGLQEIQYNSQHIREMIEDILNLTRLQSNELELHADICDWPGFFTRIYHNFQVRAKEKNIDLQLQTPSLEQEVIFLDRKKVMRVINNLIGNAIKFTPKGGTVRLEIKKEERDVCVRVADTGPGISAKDLPYIFDRYYKGSNTENGGFGIGLALSKAYAELMQGSLILESTSSAGSSFLFRFPLASSPKLGQPYEGIAPLKTEPIVNQESIHNSQGNERPHLLIVEDNTELRDLLCQMLQPDYQLTTAANGQEALEKLKSGTDIILIISDIMMPKMDGFELLEQVRTAPHLQHLPFLLLTAMTENTAEEKAFNLGVDVFLSKPFAAKELKARVAGMIHNINLRKDYWQSLSHQNTGPNHEPHSELPESYDHLWLKELEGIIKDRLGQSSLKVGDLAIAMHISERTLRTRVKTYTGLSPAQYLKKIRLNKALIYLENRRFQTVSEVCFAIGMQNVSHFAQVFKEEFGVPPSAYLSSQN